MMMQRRYYYIDSRAGVRSYDYNGPMEIFETDGDARVAQEKQKRERIANLKRELAELERD